MLEVAIFIIFAYMIQVLYILSVVSLVYLVTNKSMFKPLREWATKGKRGNIIQRWFFKVVTCEFCLAFYIAPVLFYIVFMLEQYWIIYILSLPIITLTLSKLTAKIDF